MYYYIKLFENDLTNHRVIEDKPDRFRPDLNCKESFSWKLTTSDTNSEDWKQGGNGPSCYCLSNQSPYQRYAKTGMMR